MFSEVFVAGTGIISAIGTNIRETLDSFENHKSGVAISEHLSTIHREKFPLAEVKLSNSQLAEITGLDPKLSRTILLSYYAAKQAFDVIPTDLRKHLKLGFISASSVGGMDKSEFFFEQYMEDSNFGDLRDVMNHDCGKATDYVAQKLGISGFISTISTACSSAANAIMLGSKLIRNGKLDAVMVGGVDALTRFTLNGFNSLMIVDTQQCRPFDNSRKGLNLGEGAAYLVLTSEKFLKEFNTEALCKISGFANTNDSYHQTAISEEGNGPFYAMTGALKNASLSPTDIDYINVHGTGTQNNDSSESRALNRIFEKMPPLSSTKSFTGHTLGASGAIEAVFSATALKQELILPNYFFNDPVEGSNIYVETKFQRGVKLNHILSNSFGFGGNCTSLILSKAN